MEQDKIDEAWKFLEEDKDKFESMVKRQSLEASSRAKEFQALQDKKKELIR